MERVSDEEHNQIFEIDADNLTAEVQLEVYEKRDNNFLLLVLMIYFGRLFDGTGLFDIFGRSNQKV